LPRLQIDFRKFAQLVMGSKTTDGTSVGSISASQPESDDNGTSQQMIRRRVREQWKPLGLACKRADPEQTGLVTFDQLTQILGSHGIDLNHQQLRKQLGTQAARVPYQQFFSLYAKGGSSDRQTISTIHGVSREQALEMIRGKVQQKLTGGPAGLRRAFKLFDRDGSNKVSRDELRTALHERGLLFEEPIFDAVFKHVTMGESEMDYHSFSNNLMGSKSDDSTSCSFQSAGTGDASRAVDGTTEAQIRRKVRECFRKLQVAFHHADSEGAGEITTKQLRSILEQHDIMMPNPMFDKLVGKMDANGDGQISYEEFFSFFKMGTGEGETKEAMVGTISNMGLKEAQQLIREKIAARLPGGPSELRRTFQLFDGDGSGTISLAEFRDALRLQVGKYLIICALSYNPPYKPP
jgi:Ca2+-binding EF-hand superfamily protein